MSHLLEDAFKHINDNIDCIISFEDKLMTWINKYEPNAFITFDMSHYDIVKVELTDMYEWMRIFHNVFCDELGLKLVNVEKRINYQCKDTPRFYLEYSYDSNILYEVIVDVDDEFING